MTADTVFDFSALASAGAVMSPVEEGARIFLEGETGAEMFVVAEGRIGIKSGGLVVDNIGPGGIFGEMALIDGSPRSASAIAVEPSRLAVIDKAAFLALVRHDPNFALMLMRLLAHRLRRTTESL